MLFLLPFAAAMEINRTCYDECISSGLPGVACSSMCPMSYPSRSSIFAGIPIQREWNAADNCYAFCRNFNDVNLVKACQYGCRPHTDVSNRRRKYEVQDSCRSYCDSISEQMHGSVAPCKCSCAFYDETQGPQSCTCDSSSSYYDKSCRAGCDYMDRVWHWEGWD